MNNILRINTFHSVWLTMFEMWLGYSAGQECNFRQYIEPGQAFTIANPNYPNTYSPGTYCSWVATTRRDAEVHLECPYVKMRYSWNGGCIDYLAVTNTGNVQDGSAYCMPFKLKGPTIIMQLISNSWRGGGLFSCNIWSELKGGNKIPPDENCECGWSFMKRIVGGQETGINEFPSMAGLVNVQLQRLWCGATIVSDRVALTAAHCIYEKSPKEFGLLIGDHDISTGSDTNATVLMKITAMFPHELYQPQPGLNDIGVVIPDRPIEYTARVGPACLPFNERGPLLREKVTAVGWGSMEFGGSPSDTLKKVSIEVIPPDKCEEIYSAKFEDAQHLCTFSSGKDACQFDSGGPLYYLDPIAGRQILVGIINHGRDCGKDDPAVNLKVSSFLDWIQAKLPSANFCVK